MPDILKTDASVDGQKRVESFSFLLAAVFSVSLCAVFAGRCYYKLQPATIVLDTKINPNSADLASLEQLPSIGKSLGSAIIDYREDFEGAAFKRPQDLTNVRGIGVGKLAAISEYLRFD
ncbi:MAG: helix-hairpin-helix domain-containing protein [Phycisphaerae bacterium]|nr:helix-hairpin-helix domain-containing protein [Phycisphaerae bacterium]